MNELKLKKSKDKYMDCTKLKCKKKVVDCFKQNRYPTMKQVQIIALSTGNIINQYRNGFQKNLLNKKFKINFLYNDAFSRLFLLIKINF